MRSTGCGKLVEAGAAGVFARDFLGVAFNSGRLLAFAFLGRFFVELAAADFGQDTRLFAGALEAAQGDFERLVFAYFYLWQSRFLMSQDIKGA
mgnify:CR=1 FL=1